ncbi:MAG TPA: phospholipid methyltransferase [Dokdonella sp.]|uniref:class I SAM-dependent methyltransferase n=1 Tax=Dokdonella sp. TaxID=2291710 RepID=UPI002C0C953F|nr:phospholipid methyltransferase [Dokdonella sp.]HUD40770.1 phospholipid methyltransferase [Dokdonella sp.]
MSDPLPESSAPYESRRSSASSAGLAFLRSWLREPRRVGALAPSSRALARLICSEIDPAQTPVLELGPGTGVFTEALLARGLAPSQLILVESCERFAGRLRRCHPQMRVLQIDAARLAGHPALAGVRAGAAVSGLPLRAMQTAAVESIVAATFGCMTAQASLYQFTYGLRCPVPKTILRRHGLSARAIGRVWGNLPPATVYRIGPNRSVAS